MFIFKAFLFFILFFVFNKNIYASEKMENEKTIIKSEKIQRINRDTIKAIGNVEVKQDNRVLNTEEIEYNQKTKVIKSNSNVKLYDKDNESVFFSETATANDDLLNADLYNAILIFRDGSSVSSPHMSRIDEKIISMKDIIYNACPTNLYNENLTYDDVLEELKGKGKTPLISLRTHKAKANTEEKIINLSWTSFWFKKVPFFFLPAFKTSYDYEEDLNGFDIPKIESTSYYGYGIYTPYRITRENYRAVITPKIYQEGNYLVSLKYSTNSKEESPFQEGKNNSLIKAKKWVFNLQGDLANDNNASKNLTNAYGITEYQEGDYRKLRGYIETNGYYDFNKEWGVNHYIKLATDRYYLRDYYRDGSEYIQNFIKLTKVNLADDYDFNYFQFTNLSYQELLEKDNINNPRYVPILNMNLQDYISKNDTSNLLYKIQTNTTSLFRKDGLQYNRFSLIPSLNYMKNGAFGTINSDFNLKGDLYVVNEYNTNLYDEVESRVVPNFNIEWRKSFLSNNFLFEPILKYSWTSDSEDFENKIPNEDSKIQILNFQNIFSNNRFAGYDRQEYGNRITYGFESLLFNNLSFGLAQSYRDNFKEDNANNLILLGFEEDLSDFVGYSSYVFNNNFDVYYKFLLDKDDFKLKRQEIIGNANFKHLNLYFGYSEIQPSLSITNTKEKQINSGIFFTLYKEWKMRMSGILDLKHNNRFLESEIALIYDGGCTEWEISYSNYNPLTETERNTSLSFNFNFKFF